MLKKTFIGVAVALALFLLVVALQPSEYSVTRSSSISAPAADVFAQVNDFHNWDKWSPWAKLDPQAKNTFEGAPAGTGAIFSWDGNKQVGAGRMTITESRPNELVHLKLEFLRPFPSTADTVFTFKPEGEQTVVTWTMSGKNSFLSKMFCLFMSMDKMIGTDFERGLASMKSTVESPVKM